MLFLFISFIAGIVATRYIFPIFDMLLELFNHWINQHATKIQIETNLMSLEYEEAASKGSQLTSAIGFLNDSSSELDSEFEEDPEGRKRTGKIGFK